MDEYKARYTLLIPYVLGWGFIGYCGMIGLPVYLLAFLLAIHSVNTVTVIRLPVSVRINGDLMTFRFPLRNKTLQMQLSKISQKKFRGNPLRLLKHSDHIVLGFGDGSRRIAVWRMGIHNFDGLCMRLGISNEKG